MSGTRYVERTAYGVGRKRTTHYALRTTFWFWIFVFTLHCPSAHAGPTAEIISYKFDQHFVPNERIDFEVTGRNTTNGPLRTLALIVLVPLPEDPRAPQPETQTASVVLQAGEERLFRLSFQLRPKDVGLFSVSISLRTPLNDDEDRLAVLDRETAPVPIHVGTAEASISVFPRTLPLGPLPPGRWMFPQPLKISYEFFRFNNLRLDQPFYIRIYTRNAARVRGVPGAIHQPSPAGLVSSDGRYTIPLKVWNGNFGPDVEETGWDPTVMGPPPVNQNIFWKGPLLDTGRYDEPRVAWQRVPDFSEMDSNVYSWRVLMGQDPFSTRFAKDNNQTGDFTLPSPFDLYLAAETSQTTPAGTYHTTLVVELYSP